ncbi:MAG TPA: hypothetical protein V6D19_01765 [Stenomitos sp.]
MVDSRLRFQNLIFNSRADDCEDELADAPLSVRVPVETDRIVRSLPNKTAWLRRVIVDAAQHEFRQQPTHALQIDWTEDAES